MSAEWFLYQPAGFGIVSDPDAVALIDDVLIPKLDAVPEEKRDGVWLSVILARADAPPIVRIWLQPNGSLESDHDGLVPDDSYKCLFDGTASDGTYVHVSYPCRTTALSQHVGPAGVYLFLRSRDAAASMPSCLVGHLRVFVQALVTAQLHALSQHVLADLQRAAEPFALHQGHLLLILNSAQQIAKRVDPLSIDFSDISALKSAAARVLQARDSRGNLRFHNVSDLQKIAADSQDEMDLKGFLNAFQRDLEALTSPVSALVLREYREGSLAQRWALARMCFTSTLSIGLLTDDRTQLALALRPFQSTLPSEPGKDFDAERLRTERYLSMAVAQLAQWKITARLEAGTIITVRFDLGTCVLTLSGWANASEVLAQSIAYLESKRARADSGGDHARALARILRGMAGTARPELDPAAWDKFKETVTASGNCLLLGHTPTHVLPPDNAQ